MAADAFCQHNKFGFCKHGEKCWKKHVEEICKNENCDINQCRKRHPQLCRYFSVYKRCKFGQYCAFSHEIPIDPIFEEIKALNEKMESLEKQNREIKDVLGTLEKALQSKIPPEPEVAPINNSSMNLPCSNMPTQTILTTVTTNPSSPAITSHETHDYIPQLDGPIHSKFECENCGKNFENEEELKTHTDQHEWGCEDCNVCFTTKYSADLHELEHHADSPDSISYIRDYIPESTKRMFAAGHRQR